MSTVMKLIPEIQLPKNLEIPYSPEIFDWVKENLQGLKYITFKRYLSDKRYEPQCCRINVNENATPSSIPEDSVNSICEAIGLVLQYQVEERDSAGMYCVTIYRKGEGKNADRPIAKHIKAGRDETNERELTIQDPNRVNGTLLDAQFTYIQMLQDQVVSVLGMMTGVLGPVIDMNKDLQKNMLEIGRNQVEIKKMEYEAEANREEQKVTLILERDRIAASKAKMETAFKYLNKNGGLDKLMSQVATKLLGEGNENEEIKKPVKKKPVPLNPVPTNEPSDEDKEKEYEEQARKELEMQMKLSPLHTLCSSLKFSLDQDDSESIRNYMKEELRESLYNDLMGLLSSENEEEAKINLITLRDNLEESDYPILMMIKTQLNSTQQKLIMGILNHNNE